MNPSWQLGGVGKPTASIHKIRDWPARGDALKRRGSPTVWLGPAMSWEARPTAKRGRQPVRGDATVQTCLAMMVLFGMAVRHTTGLVESRPGLAGSNRDMPSLGTLSRRQKTLVADIPCRGPDDPLHRPIDIESAERHRS